MIRRILATTALAGVLATAAGAQDSQDPVRLTLHDWTGQLITTRIMGEVLEKAGLNVEYVQADYLAQFAGLKTGDLHVAMEIWETTGRGAMDEADRHRPGRQPRRDRHAGDGGVVVPRLHEGGVPGPARLGGAARARLRRGLRHAGDRCPTAATSAAR